MCVFVCVCERERERERMGGGDGGHVYMLVLPDFMGQRVLCSIQKTNTLAQWYIQFSITLLMRIQRSQAGA